MRATKFNEGKLRWSLLPIIALRAVIKSLMLGADKYGDFNWLEGRPYSEYYDAALRHITAWWTGENKDEDGQLHLAAGVVNLLFLLTFWLTGREELDDRMVLNEEDGENRKAGDARAPAQSGLCDVSVPQPDEHGVHMRSFGLWKPRQASSEERMAEADRIRETEEASKEQLRGADWFSTSWW